MTSPSVDRLSGFLERRLGDDLRSVTVMTEDDWQVVYIREDLRTHYTSELFGRTVDAFRPLDRSQFGEDIPLGNRTATVHYHENAFVLCLAAPDEWVVVSVSSSVGRHLQEFIARCRTVLEA